MCKRPSDQILICLRENGSISLRIPRASKRVRWKHRAATLPALCKHAPRPTRPGRPEPLLGTCAGPTPQATEAPHPQPYTPEWDGPPRISARPRRRCCPNRTLPLQTRRRLSASVASLPAGPGPTRPSPINVNPRSPPPPSGPLPLRLSLDVVSSPFRPVSLSTPFCSKPERFRQFFLGKQ